MDFVSSAFQFDQVEELLQFSSIPFQQHTIQQDTLLVRPPFYSGDVTKNPNNCLQRKSSVAFGDIGNNLSDYKRKKIIHRDVERQRRQEMAALYRSLRSLLPPQNLKGKKSMSDHMHEAVNYIKQLEKRVEEMREKRDELKRSMDPITNINAKSQCSASCLQESVTVEASRSGFQVAVNTAACGGLSVSKVLDVLTREGLTVVSCISTNVNERQLHIIKSEVGDEGSINPSELQNKLADLMA